MLNTAPPPAPPEPVPPPDVVSPSALQSAKERAEHSLAFLSPAAEPTAPLVAVAPDLALERIPPADRKGDRQPTYGIVARNTGSSPLCKVHVEHTLPPLPFPNLAALVLHRSPRGNPVGKSASIIVKSAA
jgi:hypothetical protein